MGKKIVGIEIGNDTLKIALCANGRVIKLATKQLHFESVVNGEIVSVNDVAGVIRSAMKEFKISGAVGAVVLPSTLVIGRTLSLPLMTEEKYKNVLPSEFSDIVGKEIYDYYYDYIIKSVDKNEVQMYACAVLKRNIDKYYELFRKAGLKLQYALPAEIAWMKLIASVTTEPQNICIVDIGYKSTSLYIFSNGVYEMGRTVEIGGYDIDTKISDYLNVDLFAARSYKEENTDNCVACDGCTTVYADIAAEVTQTIRYYNEINTEKQVRDVYYCGGSAIIEPLRDAICRTSDTTPHHISRLVLGATEKTDVETKGAVAVGAAI